MGSIEYMIMIEMAEESKRGTHLVHIGAAKKNGHLSIVTVSPDSNRFLLERKTGFEPATFSLARRCSTTEPLPHGASQQVGF